METIKKKLSNGHYVYLTKVDKDQGIVEFPGRPGAQPVKDPGTYHYDQGGSLYKEACDLYRKNFD